MSDDNPVARALSANTRTLASYGNIASRPCPKPPRPPRVKRIGVWIGRWFIGITCQLDELKERS